MEVVVDKVDEVHIVCVRCVIFGDVKGYKEGCEFNMKDILVFGM